MIFKEVGQTMDLLLVKVAEEHHIDAGVVEKILQVEKDHVYQKSRHTRGPIRQIIAEMYRLHIDQAFLLQNSPKADSLS